MAEIDSLFLPKVAATIKAIPLCLFDRDDLPFWPYTHDGVFSVKSGYRLLMEQDHPKQLDTSNGGVNSNVWKAMWHLHVPNQVKSLPGSKTNLDYTS